MIRAIAGEDQNCATLHLQAPTGEWAVGAAMSTVLLPKKIPLIIRGLDYTQPENAPLFYASFFILNNLNLKYATLFNPFN